VNSNFLPEIPGGSPPPGISLHFHYAANGCHASKGAPHQLFLLKSRACGAFTVTCVSAPDIHMIGMAFIIGIINAFRCLAVNADGFAGMDYRTFERIGSCPLLNKAFAAGIITIAGMLSAHHNISLTAQAILIVDTTLHSAS